MPLSIKNTPRKRERAPCFKPGMKALRDIYRARHSVGLLVPRASFDRLGRRLGWNSPTGIKRFSKEGLRALQEATEAHTMRYFDVANRSAIHAGHVTMQPEDVSFIRVLRRSFDFKH